MSRLIDADHLFDRMRQAKNNQPELGDVYEDEIEIMAEWIRTEPTADVRENVRGEWVCTKDCVFVCSICHCDRYGRTYQDGTVDFNNYCPCCGADMRGGNDGK